MWLLFESWSRRYGSESGLNSADFNAESRRGVLAIGIAIGSILLLLQAGIVSASGGRSLPSDQLCTIYSDRVAINPG